MKYPVSIISASGYGAEIILAALRELLAPLGGMAAFVRPGQRVLIKPNMLSARPPEKAVTTHPEVVRGIIRLVQECGGVPWVGDSPGVGSTLSVAAKCGILDVVRDTGAALAHFRESVPFPHDIGRFPRLEIAREALEADVIINLPKLKTHQMMGGTGAIKNLFGVVVGLRKVNLHLQAGSDKALFARLLLDLARHVAPALTVVDAVMAMEGNGPGSGTPVAVGALLGGCNPLAVDTAAFAMLGLRPDAVWTQKIAREEGCPGSFLDDLELFGPPLESLRPPSFRPAREGDIGFGIPSFLRRGLNKSLSALPEVDMGRCLLCGICQRHCPVEAISVHAGFLEIDKRLCIGCFCCQELCPEGAIEARQGILLRLYERFTKQRSKS
ncbi:MAG: DUF362 domain-containing protein [Desulfuromonadaceae bacterium]|nr:DUF362 domain-containing protein [Desulfuromonadaceae bacterium]